MLVWRLEKDGIGPYMYQGLDDIAQCLVDTMNEAHSQTDKFDEFIRPPITVDFDVFYPEMVCGFKSLQDLRVWFIGYLKALKGFGFRIHTYETDDFIMGKSGKQLMFNPMFSTKLLTSK